MCSQRRKAREQGRRLARARSNGAITFVQRFNSALELSLHFHMLVPDGVFVTGGVGVDERPEFVKLEGPSDEEVAELLAEVAKRVTKMLHAHGRMLNDECEEEGEPQLVFAGRRGPTSSGPQHEEALPPRCARQEGYSLHAGRQVHQNDRVGLEQLARYGLRPALSLERLSEAGDGTVLYEMKRRFSDGRHTLRFTPRELLLQLCALVPPRGFHMVRYHGIFAPHARGRFALTGRGVHDGPAVPRAPVDHAEPTAAVADGVTGAALQQTQRNESMALSSASTGTSSTAAQQPTLEAATWKPPDDTTRARRLEGSLLMKRSYALDVLCCPRCQGPMRLIAVIDNELVARRILEHLGLPARAPPRGRSLRLGQERLPGLAADPEPTDVWDGVDPLPTGTC